MLAILALAGGWLLGWSWLDPVMGIVGAVLVGTWAFGLLRQTGVVLLDPEMDHGVVAEIQEMLATFNAGTHSTHVTDLHVWRVGNEKFSWAISLVTNDETLSVSAIRSALAIHEEIVHLTVEVHHYGDGNQHAPRTLASHSH